MLGLYADMDASFRTVGSVTINDNRGHALDLLKQRHGANAGAIIERRKITVR